MWHEGDVYRAQRGQSRGAAAGLGAQDMLVSGKTAIAEPSLADVAGPYRTAGGAMAGLSIGVQSAYGSQRSARAGERDGQGWFLKRFVEVLASPIPGDLLSVQQRTGYLSVFFLPFIPG